MIIPKHPYDNHYLVATRPAKCTPLFAPPLRVLPRSRRGGSCARPNVNGVKGGKFTSKKNGASIFLPAAGSRWSDGLYGAGPCANNAAAQNNVCCDRDGMGVWCRGRRFPASPWFAPPFANPL